MSKLQEELGYVAWHENKAFSIITRRSVKTTLKGQNPDIHDIFPVVCKWNLLTPCKCTFKRHYARKPGHYVAFLQNIHGMGLATDPTKSFNCLISKISTRGACRAAAQSHVLLYLVKMCIMINVISPVVLRNQFGLRIVCI